MSVATSVSPPMPTSAVFGRSATLPAFEVDKRKVQSKGIRIAGQSRGSTANPWSSLGRATQLVSVSDWQLFHIAAKTELARSFSVSEAARRATCFSLLYDDLFDWNATHLCLRDGAVNSRKDVARTNAAGRFGESCALRLMQELGFIFWDHLPTLWNRAKGPITHAEQVSLPKLLVADPSLLPREQPDFIVENPGMKIALVEAKGSFATPQNSPSYYPLPSTAIKQTLNEALSQLARWPPLISPGPSSFAVGTFLREASDGRDPSLIAYADPEGDAVGEPQPIRLRPDAIRRGNYGAWLMGMGFNATGNSLRNGLAAELARVDLPIVRVEGDDFAFTLNPFCCPCQFPLSFGGQLLPDGMGIQYLFAKDFDLAYRWFALARGNIPIIGMELGTLRVVEAAAIEARSNSLLEVQGLTRYAQGLKIPPVDSMPTFEPTGFFGSVMPDGTLLGAIATESPIWGTLRMESFTL